MTTQAEVTTDGRAERPESLAVRDWMSADPLTVSPDADTRDARVLLHRYGIRHLPVVDDDRVVGMISDRDVRIDQSALDDLPDARVVERLRARRSVEAVMSSPPHVIGPDDSIAEAARRMLSRRISALPVVEDDVLVGMLTTTDCLLALLDSPA